MKTKLFSDESLIETAEAVLTDMRVTGPPVLWNGAAGFVKLPNGMLAEVQVTVTTDKRDWLTRPDSEVPVFIVKQKGAVSIRKRIK